MAQDAFKVETMPHAGSLLNAQCEIGTRIFMSSFMVPWELFTMTWGMFYAPLVSGHEVEPAVEAPIEDIAAA